MMENSLKKREICSMSTDSDELGNDNRSQSMNIDGKNVSAETNAKRGDVVGQQHNFGRLGVDVGKDTEFPSSKTSVASSDADLDDAKSTGSSHPFSSPNPSEYDDHGISNDLHATNDKLDLKRPYKRRKQLELLYTGRLAYPLSERKQMALLMQMTAPEQQNEQPKSPGSAPPTTGAKVRGKLAKIHRRNDRGETSLHKFAKQGDNQQVLELIREGAEVNVVDYAGWTPLHEACSRGCYETAEILIKHGANVNACGLEDDTPLHDAALSANKELVILLLRHGGDAFKANARNKSPLDVAEEREDKEIIELLKYGPPPSVDGGTSSTTDSTKIKPDFSFNTSKISSQSSPKDKFQSSPKEKFQSSPKEKFQLSPKEKFQSSPKDKFQSSPKEKFKSSPKDIFQSSPKEKIYTSPKDKYDLARVELSASVSTTLSTQAVPTTNYPSTISKCETDSIGRLTEISRSTSNYSSLSAQSSHASNEIFEERTRHIRDDDRKIETFVDATISDDSDDQKINFVNAEVEPKTIQPATLTTCSATSVDSECEARLVVVEDEETDKEEKMCTNDIVECETRPPVEHELESQPTSSDSVSVHRSLHTTPKIERPKRRIIPPMRTNYASVTASPKKIENRGRKRKVVEKDVYEFHSSDSDVDVSINESPLNANRRKLVKLTDQLKGVTLDTSSHNTSLDELNSTKTSSDSTIGYLLNKSDNDIVTAASLDQPSVEMDDDNLNVSKDAIDNLNESNDLIDADVDESPKSDALAPNGRVRSSSHGSATFSPISTTTLMASRKERLLGFRRRRGSHAALRYGNSGTNASRQLRIDDIVRNVSAGTENGVASSVAEPIRSTTYNCPQDVPASTTSSPIDGGRHKSDSDVPNDGNGAPKVPPLKLVLSNTVRCQIAAAEEDMNRSYIVRSRASSFDKREDVDDATSSNCVSTSNEENKRNNGGYSSLNVSSSSISVGSPSVGAAAGSESTQRVTRSQVRLHGPNNEFIRRIEEAQVFLPKKRKLKQKTIEPVAASRHWKPVLSMNLAGMASKNSFEAHHELRKTIEQKWQEARIESDSICYTKPNGYNKFLLSKKSYLLRHNDQKLSADNNVVPADLPPVMSDLYKNQEKEREEMRVKHRIERERLILACETEAIRVHNRVSRGTADPPMSAMRVLRDADVYNPLQLDKPIPFSDAAISLDRYVETCSMDDVLVRFGRSKRQLVGRQRLESDCLMATQFNEWTIKHKSNNAVVVNIDLVAAKPKSPDKFCDRSSFPVVCIVSEFDLLPQEFVSS